MCVSNRIRKGGEREGEIKKGRSKERSKGMEQKKGGREREERGGQKWRSGRNEKGMGREDKESSIPRKAAYCSWG